MFTKHYYRKDYLPGISGHDLETSATWRTGPESLKEKASGIVNEKFTILRKRVLNYKPGRMGSPWCSFARFRTVLFIGEIMNRKFFLFYAAVFGAVAFLPNCASQHETQKQSTALTEPDQLQALHYSRDGIEANKIADLYQGLMVFKGEKQTGDLILELKRPPQNLATEAGAQGLVVCQPLIDEKAIVRAVYVNYAVHPLLARAVIDSLLVSRFNRLQSPDGKKLKYSMRLYFPFYPSKIDFRSLPTLEERQAQEASFDIPPQPVGGFAAIQRNLIYPQQLRRLGIQGKVIVMTAVDSKGNVGEFKILEANSPEFAEAAIEAIRSVRWQPAKWQGKAVSAWVGVPVYFKLN